MDDRNSAAEQIGESTSDRINRRRILKTVGGAAAGSILLPGAASAHIDEGPAMSWVAFCGCDGGYNIRYVRCNDEGELGAVAYDCDGGTVYYKAGRNIYRHEHTRRNEDTDPDNDIDWRVIEVDYAGNEDPVASTTPSDSRDPCGILADTGGTKLEEDEIRAEADSNNCDGDATGDGAGDEEGPTSGPPSDGETIVDVALAADDFEILVAAIEEAERVDALSGNRQLTVFAPTDKAFENLAEELGVEVTDLLELPNLADILLYHVTNGRRNSQSVVNAPKIEMLNGETVEVDGTVLNDGQATIIDTDVEASNGLIHVIDGVLLPQ